MTKIGNRFSLAPAHLLSQQQTGATQVSHGGLEADACPQTWFLESLYHAGPVDLEAALVEVPDSAHTVLALGHNPGWSSAVIWLTEKDIQMTTANAALCQVDANSWNEAARSAGSWTLEQVLRPKEL